MKTTSINQPCSCGGPAYVDCCARFIERGILPENAAELMRSRYTAYTRRETAYLQATWHRDTCPATLQDDEPNIKWLGLELRRHTADGDTATVEFVARYRLAGRAHRLHEISRFVREDGRWLYVDGTFPEGKP